MAPISASPTMLPEMSLAGLQAAFASGTLSPTTLVKAVHATISAQPLPIWTHIPSLDQLCARASTLEAIPADQRGPLWGIPCAVKDNVDVGGMPTTAACPSFSYTPEQSATAVQALEEAGVIIFGKTNMDQFAAGLVGTRSPYGAPCTPFDPRFISGGSSSGSAAAVGGSLVTFALGTDTAGSGRVPAGFCGCVGIKGTVGSVSTVGVVPACASLDCLTVFARSVEEGAEVMRVMKAAHAGPADVWRRAPPASVQPLPASGFRFAVPPLTAADWRTPGGPLVTQAAMAEFAAAAKRLESLGGVPVSIDFTPFMTVAAMLYGTAFVAERYSGIRKFLEQQDGSSLKQQQANGTSYPAAHANVAEDERLFPVTRAIISGAAKFSASDLYDTNAKLAALRAAALHELSKVDILLVPTALAHYTIQEVEAEENTDAPKWSQNANLGRFTNFVNLLDMCGCAVPSGLVHIDALQAEAVASETAAAGQLSEQELAQVQARTQHLQATGSTNITLPFGVTLLASAWQDEWLWGVASAMHKATGFGCGPDGHSLKKVAV